MALMQTLSSATARLRALMPNPPPLTSSEVRLPAVAVLGNEGGDYDSVVGALYTAWAGNVGHLTVDAVPHGTPFVPFLNFPLEDLPLRGDIFQSLQRHHVDSTDLLSAVEGDGLALLNACQWVLLFDHNKVTASQSHLQQRVVAVLDHHADEGLNTSANPRVVRTAGSCCSILATMLAGAVTEIPEKPLLLGAVLLDTANFSAAMKKTTPTDLAAAKLLAGLADDATVDGITFVALFDELSAWKSDVSHLTIAQSLRRDYKAFTMPSGNGKLLRVGIAAWVESCETVLARWTGATVIAELQAHCASNQLDATIIMFAAGAGSAFRREALWVCANTAAAQVLNAYFNEPATRPDAQEGFTSAPDLSTMLTSSPDASVGVVRQQNVAVSRKQLVPALTSFVALSKL